MGNLSAITIVTLFASACASQPQQAEAPPMVPCPSTEPVVAASAEPEPTASLSLPDLPDSHRPLQRRCEIEESGGACNSLGVAFRRGDGVPKNNTHAFALYERACELRSAFGCMNAAALADAGEGTEVQLPKARRYQKYACLGANAQACYAYAVMLRSGRGGPKDIQGAIRHFRKLCMDREAEGCAELGSTHATEGDRARANLWWRHACELGSEDACKSANSRASGSNSTAHVGDIFMFNTTCSLFGAFHTLLGDRTSEVEACAPDGADVTISLNVSPGAPNNVSVGPSSDDASLCLRDILLKLEVKKAESCALVLSIPPTR